MTKRLLDIVVSAIGLVVLFPLFTVVGALIRLESDGPVLFKQIRIGRRLTPFTLYKFRTMRAGEPAPTRVVLATSDDPRVTRVGRVLRRTKIDELPQLVNVFKGEMSLVGPRPEVRQYVEIYRKDFEEILQMRPGMTDLASVKYRDEARILARALNVEEEYLGKILPDKIELAKRYIRESSLRLDLVVIWKTLCGLVDRRE